MTKKMEQKKHNVKYFFIKNLDKIIIMSLKIKNIEGRKDETLIIAGN
jgi:hypothetical protein